VVTATDTGRGIHPDVLDAVFVRGFRGRSSSGTDGSGTGLATVRSLLQHMGGDAWAERHDGGARVCIRLRTVESTIQL
jgi:signal transduction histidine kinase